MSKNYDRETKLAYVQQIESGQLTVAQAAKELSISQAAIYRWKSQLKEDPQFGLPGSGHSKPDIEYTRKLERDCEALKKEVEFLKKAAAYFAVDQKKNMRS